jgi:RNA polymerase primary sigma factor
MRDATAVDFTACARSYHTGLKTCQPIKSKTKERQLLKKAKQGDMNARNEILKANLRYVFNIAKKYRGYGIPMEELISEGNMGLLYALTKYDMNNDVKFITYASWWVKYYLIDSIKKHGDRNKVEVSKDERLIDVNAYSTDEYSSGSDCIDAYSQTTDEEERELGQDEIIQSLLGTLSDRERSIVETYYGIKGKKQGNLEYIASEIGITKERVRQIKDKGIEKLQYKAVSSSRYSEFKDLY